MSARIETGVVFVSDDHEGGEIIFAIFTGGVGVVFVDWADSSQGW